MIDFASTASTEPSEDLRTSGPFTLDQKLALVAELDELGF